jgi:hypothetical protein
LKGERDPEEGHWTYCAILVGAPSRALGRCFSWAPQKLPIFSFRWEIALRPVYRILLAVLSLVSYADLCIIVVKKIMSEWLTYSSQFLFSCQTHSTRK